MTLILEVQDINKVIDEKVILSEFNMAIQSNTIHALLGPNGAGKTSLLKVILGINQYNSGEVTLNGSTLSIPYSKETRRLIGYLPDEPILTNLLTGMENLSYMNYIYGKPKSDEELASILDSNGIAAAKDVLVKDYSKGMKQRLSLSIMDLFNPILLILDEPTLGLDIVGVNNLRYKLKNYQKQGCTVLLTTHDIHFCQEIADNVTLINDGCNIDQGATADWLSKYDNIELAMIDKLNLSKEA